jgi:hypothetical protein
MGGAANAHHSVHTAPPKGTKRTWRDVRLESVVRTKADVRWPRADLSLRQQPWFAARGLAHGSEFLEPDQSCLPV